MLSGPDQLSDFQVYSVYGGAYETFSKIVFDGIDDCPFSLLQLKTRKYCPLDVRQPGARRARRSRGRVRPWGPESAKFRQHFKRAEKFYRLIC